MNVPAGYSLIEIDVRNISDADIARYNRHNNVMKAERRPEEPPTPLELSVAGWRNIPAIAQVWEWAVVHDETGHIVASASCGIDTTAEENLHLLQGGIGVEPDHRGRGLAKALLPHLAATARQLGRTKLLFSTESVVPAGEALAQRLGAEAGLVMRTSELRLDNVDREMVRRWVEEAPSRAPGYSLELIEGAYPEEMLPEICRVLEVMNTAPRDTLDMEDEKVTPQQLLEGQKSMLARGVVRWSMFIRHDESGQLAGYTDTYWQPELPKTVGQGGTAVDPAHRGHALGKWLKAAMIDKILRERPEAERILTGNAYTNDAMLGINNQLGFKEERSETIWQVEVERVEAYLAG
jgi:GNAT superfamily N-acetyltransferase